MKLIYGKYYCTQDGKVFNYKTGKELKQQKHEAGYLRVGLMVEGKKKNKRVHRLVWEYFKGDIPRELQINHLNGIKDDNRLINLEITTQSKNIKHADSNGLRKNYRNKPYKILNLDTNEISMSMQDTSLRLGLHRTALSTYFRRTAKTCGGYRWKKLED